MEVPDRGVDLPLDLADQADVQRASRLVGGQQLATRRLGRTAHAPPQVDFPGCIQEELGTIKSRIEPALKADGARVALDDTGEPDAGATDEFDDGGGGVNLSHATDDAAGEDDGYLMTFVFDQSTARSEFVIWDARDAAAPPRLHGNRSARGGRVVAVGTTSVRTLETCAGEDGTVSPSEGVTRKFIVPGYRFRAVDALLTNFHLPRSSLLALVMAFAGVEAVRAAYRAAVAEGYRFYSYGDAMLVA